MIQHQRLDPVRRAWRAGGTLPCLPSLAGGRRHLAQRHARLPSAGPPGPPNSRHATLPPPPHRRRCLGHGLRIGAGALGNRGGGRLWGGGMRGRGQFEVLHKEAVQDNMSERVGRNMRVAPTHVGVSSGALAGGAGNRVGDGGGIRLQELAVGRHGCAGGRRVTRR